MMWPVLCKVRYELLLELFRSRDLWRQVALSLVLNWLVGPLPGPRFPTCHITATVDLVPAA